MDSDWMDSGERLVPERESGGVIEAEHLVRYRLALAHVAGLSVLDAGCGVGWGSQLLLDEGGAANVVGVDLFAPALEYARQKYPGPDYRLGDMAALPIEDASIDVVVCLEALEHVQDHRAVLSEFRRVLRPGGWLLVSSPNPDVYPPDNPYHVHELRPEELVAAVSTTFEHHALLNQELLIASLVTSAEASQDAVVPLHLIGDRSGTNPYGIVVAGDAALPDLDSQLVLAPSAQLSNLDAAGRALVREREEFTAQAEAVAREQARLERAARDAGEHAAALTERTVELENRLSEAGEALAGVMRERDELVDRVDATAELAEARRAAQDKAMAELNLARADRDRALVAVLNVEQELARSAEHCQHETELVELRATADMLSQELNAMRLSRSWRITWPLRALRDRQLALRNRSG